MIEETATVVALDGEHAWIETQRKSSCGSCSASGGCGTSVLSEVLGNRPVRVHALNQVDAQVGETVVVGINEGSLVRGSLAVYIVPLLTMIAGGLFGKALAPQLQAGDTLVAVCGLLGLGLGFVWLWLFSRRIRDDGRYQAVILRRTPVVAVSVGMPGPHPGK